MSFVTPVNIALSGEIPEELLLSVEEDVMLRLCYTGEPYSYQESYEQALCYIREKGVEICGDSLELWTIGNKLAGKNTYVTLIDIPINGS